MRRILILVNLPQRDQATDQLLAAKLRERGCDVRVANFLPRCRDHILFYKPDVVIGPEPRCEFTIAFYKQCMMWGVYTVSKRTEPGGCWDSWHAAPEEERKTIIGGWPYDVNLEISWSQEFAEILEKHGYIPKDRIFIAGNMSLDPYFYPPFHQHPEGRKHIIIAPGWGHADASKEYSIPEAPPGSPLHEDAWNRHRKGRETWLEMIKRVQKDLVPKGYDYFIRLKCGERPDEYAAAIPGCKFVMPCDTKSALLHGDILIHAGSMMALEADLCSIPAFSFMGSLNQTVGWKYPHISQDFENVDDLIKAVESVELGKSNANKESIEILSKQFYGVADGKSCNRLADRIMALPFNVPQTPDDWPPDEPKYDGSPYAYTQVEQWICETCRHLILIPGKPGTYAMIKCPWCGISLAKCRQNQFQLKPITSI